MVDPGVPRLLVVIASILLVGLLMDVIGSRTRLPRVTLLVLLGVVIGPTGLDLLVDLNGDVFEVVAVLALMMVGFLLGGDLRWDRVRGHGLTVLAVSWMVAVVTAVLVVLGFTGLGVGVPLALLLAAVATATDPIATREVAREADAQGPFTRILLGVVALDDAWGLVVFSILLAIAEGWVGGNGALEVMLHGAWELGGGVLVGVLVGLPMAALTGRLAAGEPTLIEALGGVLLCGGVALWLDVSFLLAAVTLGATVANLAHHHVRPFRAIEGIEWPFVLVFLVLAGATVDLRVLGGSLVLLVAYVLLRVLGRVLGALIAFRLVSEDLTWSTPMGVALLPQAGVALGIAVVAAERIPDLAGMLLPTVVAATVLFEVAGPLCTQWSLRRVGEART